MAVRGAVATRGEEEEEEEEEDVATPDAAASTGGGVAVSCARAGDGGGECLHESRVASASQDATAAGYVVPAGGASGAEASGGGGSGDERRDADDGPDVDGLVRDAQARWFEELERKGEPLGVVEATLLVETGGRERFDVLVAVSAPADMRLQRAMRRSGETDPNEFVKRMAAQFSDAAREEVSDIVIRTDGTREELEGKIDALARDLRARAGRH